MSKPPIIILAAGQSSRMFPLNSIGHKSFLEIGGASFLARCIDDISKHDYTDVYIVLGEASLTHPVILKILETYKSTALNITCVVQEKPTGMGDALLSVIDQFPELKNQEQCAVIGGYTINAGSVIADLESVIYNQSNPATHAVLAAPTSEPWQYGILTFADEATNKSEHPADSEPQAYTCRVTGIVEKPKAGTEPSNKKIQLAYVLNKSFWERLKNTPVDEYSFETALDETMKKESVFALVAPTSLPTLKYSWNLLRFQKTILRNQEKTSIHPTAQVRETAVIDDTSGPIVIDEQAQVGDYAKIVGPAYIGKNAFVGDFSFVRQSSVEQDATVGSNTELVRSLIMKGATIHFGYLADSIIGEYAKIGAGLITANKRIDRGEIRTKIKGVMVETGKRQLGLIVGPKAQIGVGVRTMPGVLIAPETTVMPGSILDKNT